MPAAEVVQMAQAPRTRGAVPAAGLDALRERSGGEGPGPKKETRRSGTAQGSRAHYQRSNRSPGKSVQPAAEMRPLASRPKRSSRNRRPQAAGTAAGAAADEARKRGWGRGGSARRSPPSAPAGTRRTSSQPGDSVGPEVGRTMWRFGAGGRLVRSADGGASWQPQIIRRNRRPAGGRRAIPGRLLDCRRGRHGAAHHGRRTLGTQAVPLAVDLVAVAAANSRTAVVTTRDGRRFETLDAGLAWTPNSAQAPGPRALCKNDGPKLPVLRSEPGRFR